ncbi:MAG: contractile injection system tape measure protein [Taibaiella sp.]|jgi:hypothetical protein
MSKKVAHIIHKLNLDIDVPDERLARKMYQQAGKLLQDYVLPQLEMLLNEYDKEDLHIRLDKLNINLNADHSVSLEEMIKEQLAVAIVKELEAVIHTDDHDGDQANKQPRKPANEYERITEAFLWFLQHGTLPWWIADNTAFAESEGIINAITHTEETFVPLFVKKLEALPVMQKRLLLQFDTILLTYLLSLIVSLEIFAIVIKYEQKIVELAEEESERGGKQWYWVKVWSLYPVHELLTVNEEQLEQKLDQLLYTISKRKTERQSSDQLSETFTIELFDLNTINSEPGRDEELKRKDKADKAETKFTETEDGLLGSNAGLVLLHPFLQYFFKELGLLENEKFINDRSRDVAVHLLHYLATGKEHAADFDLVFEQYLCGMYAGQVTYRFISLSEHMKTEAVSLLQAVIKHWSVLKNTSIEGLREGFLQRNGKLIVTGNNSRIIMEQNTLDILLQQVPWNISLLKLPWMDQLIHVEWMNPL